MKSEDILDRVFDESKAVISEVEVGERISDTYRKPVDHTSFRLFSKKVGDAVIFIASEDVIPYAEPVPREPIV